jgi:hypothetical protein
MMIRPAELAAIKAGELDLAFRRWDRARVKAGTRMRTAVGVIEVTEVEQVVASALTRHDAVRSGMGTVVALRQALDAREDKRDQPIWRVTLRYAGPDPRADLREQLPTPEELDALIAWLDRLDQSSKTGPWTRQSLDLIDRHPAVRAPELAAQLRRETQPWKVDVRKLKEKGLTESLAIGYRLSPRGEAVLDEEARRRGEAPRTREPRPEGTPLPRTVGAPATRALTAHGITSLEQLDDWSVARLRALPGVGPIAIDRLREAQAERGIELG